MLILFGKRLVLAATLFSSSAFALGFFDGIFPREMVFPKGFDNAGKPEITITAFGDSILSGLDTDHEYSYIRNGSLVEQLGKILSQVYQGNVIYVNNESLAGSKSATISRFVQREANHKIKRTDYFILDGGGNDFLPLIQMPPATLCDQRKYDAVVQETLTRWDISTYTAQKNLKKGALSIYMTLHFGRYDLTKSLRCSSGSSPFLQVLTSIAKMNYHIGQLAIQNHAQIIDGFALFTCAPHSRDACDPRHYKTEADYVGEIKSLENRGLLSDPTHWYGDEESRPLSLVQKDAIHPNELGHQLLADRLFDLLGL